MKKRKHFLWWLYALVLVTSSFGQITSQVNAKVVTASQTISNQNGFSIIVGGAILGVTEIGTNSSDYQIRFPWDVLYLYETFSDDAFQISAHSHVGCLESQKKSKKKTKEGHSITFLTVTPSHSTSYVF